MRTLCAITLICLWVPAFASEDFGGLSYDCAMETGPLYGAAADCFGDEKTATIITPGTPKSEDQLVVGTEPYLYDAAADFTFGDDTTGRIGVPGAPNSEDYLLELGSYTVEDWTYQGDTVGLDTLPADDWF